MIVIKATLAFNNQVIKICKLVGTYHMEIIKVKNDEVDFVT